MTTPVDIKKQYKITVIFLMLGLITTFMLALLIKLDLIPINEDLSAFPLEPQWARFVHIWMVLVAIFAGLIPFTLWILMINHDGFAQFLALYLLVLLLQLANELLFRYYFFSAITIFIALIYNIFRLWQLQQGLSALAKLTLNKTLSFSLTLYLRLLTLLWWFNLVAVLIYVELPRLF